MLGRRRTGSVVCPSCGRLVGAAESRCPFCSHLVRGPLGVGPLLRRLFDDVGLDQLVLGACVALYLAMLAVDAGHQRISGLLGPSVESAVAFGASGPLPVFQLGRWWTPLSAGWLHGNVLHILLNLMAIRQLAPAVQHLYGTGRAVVIYVVSGVAGFVLSTLSIFAPALLQWAIGGGREKLTLGASAALFGLLGALVHYSRRGGSQALGQQVWTWAVGMFVFGLLWSEVVDNWAHLGGFLGGWLLAYWLDPLRAERPWHRLAAALCLLASAAAVAASLVTGRSLL